MRYIRLNSGKEMSELGFGCAGLLGRASRRESERAIGAALDAGITFFDTARSYGYGDSEGLLGGMFAGRRESLVLCTKFGILPAVRGGWRQKAMPLARAALKVMPFLRGAARRQAAGQFVAGQFTLETLKSSFETSLRELRTDHVDMLLLHAAPASVLAKDDLLEALGRQIEQGKTHMAGISAELPVTAQFFKERPPGLTTAQFALNPGCMEFTAETERNSDLLLVANHPFGGPGGRASARVNALRGLPDLSPVIRGKLSIGDAQVMPEVILNCILRGTGVSAVVPAMLQPRHIQSNVRAVEQCRFSDDELAVLRAAFRTHALAAARSGK